MVWIGIGIGVGVVAGVALVLAARRKAYRLASPDDRQIDDVDPMFATGIALAGGGVALAITLGPLMYLMFVVGMILMAVGAYRTRNRAD